MKLKIFNIQGHHTADEVAARISSLKEDEELILAYEDDIFGVAKAILPNTSFWETVQGLTKSITTDGQ